MNKFRIVDFTLQEIRIIQLLSDELSENEIAAIMNLAPGTIGNYRRRIQKKIGARNVVGIVLYAFFRGIIMPKILSKWQNLDN